MILFIIAFLLVYITFPWIKRLEARGLRRELVTLFIFLILSLIGLLLSSMVIPIGFRLVRGFLEIFPQYIQSAIPKVTDFLNARFEFLGIGHRLYPEQWAQKITVFVTNLLTDLSGKQVQDLSFWVSQLLTNSLNVFLGLIKLFLVPLFYFFVILDYEKIVEFLKSLVPPRNLPGVRRYIKDINLIFGGFLYGQTLVVLILALLYGAGLFLVGLDHGFLIGLMTGVLSFIPYVGFVVGFSISILVSLAQSEGYSQILAIVLVFSSIQFLEGFFITPRIVGNKVGLRPLESLLSVLIFGNIFGFLGVLLAIPLGALFKKSLLRIIVYYQTTKYYQR